MIWRGWVITTGRICHLAGLLWAGSAGCVAAVHRRLFGLPPRCTMEGRPRPDRLPSRPAVAQLALLVELVLDRPRYPALGASLPANGRGRLPVTQAVSPAG